MVGLSRRILHVLCDALTGLFAMAMRRFLLMRRVRMILGLEVFRLVRWAFAISRHDNSSFKNRH
jgi:hypothetical protein